MNKICFHVLNAYSLFDNTTRFPFGGAEYRASIFAKELAKDNTWKVDFITLNHGLKSINLSNNLTLIQDSFYKAENISENNTPLRRLKTKLDWFFVKKRFKDFNEFLKFKSLDESQADYFILFGISGLNKRVVDYCKKHKKKLILFFASDEELNLSANNFLHLTPDLINCFISNASLILCQNKFQQEALLNTFNKKGNVLLNPMVINKIFQDHSPKTKKTIIWIGKSNALKNPLLFIEVAKLNPDKNFLMFCSKSDELMHEDLKTTLPHNVTFIDTAGTDKIEEALSQPSIFISTSLKEGFANTFLQAGKNSVPIISTGVDPNDYIKNNDCGIVCEFDAKIISLHLNNLYDREDLYVQKARNHFNYVKANHNLPDIISGFKNMLLTNA